MRRGVWLAAAAYTLWGLFPLYWTQIESVPALQIIAHRIAWSFLVLLVVLAARMRRARRMAGSGSAGFVVPSLGLYGTASLLIGVNWYLYVWGVNHGLVVGTSLGYFITPLVNVLLGVLVLRESLRLAQWLAVGIATAGVVYLSIAYGAVPWISLALAGTFGTYGLVKKRVTLPAASGLTMETGILFLPAVVFLVAAEVRGNGAFLHQGIRVALLLAGAGIVTTIPLLLFATAARRIPLSALGILQYISPTIQFVLGLFVYREPFSRVQFTGFAIVWVAVLVFGIDGFVAQGRTAPALDEGEF